MAKHTGRRSRTEWQRIIAKQSSSQHSALAYCKRHGVSYPSFLYWRRRLQDLSPAVSGEPSFVELIPPVDPAPSHAPLLIELELAPGVHLRIARHA